MGLDKHGSVGPKEEPITRYLGNSKRPRPLCSEVNSDSGDLRVEYLVDREPSLFEGWGGAGGAASPAHFPACVLDFDLKNPDERREWHYRQ